MKAPILAQKLKHLQTSPKHRELKQPPMADDALKRLETLLQTGLQELSRLRAVYIVQSI